MSALRAGTAEVPLAPPLGIPMMGYALRDGTAEAHHDPLHARALFLSGAEDLLWIALDLCLIAPHQALAIRRRVSERTGVAQDAIGVGCIHTHSGPETGYVTHLADVAAPAFVAPLLDAAVEAGVRAHATAAPARLGWGRAAAEIGRNRRRSDGPLDASVHVLRVDRADGTPLAVAYVHGCHPTVLGHDSRSYSADWPGPAAAEIRRAFPTATPLFLLGAHADVDPRTRDLMDLAIEGQSRGAGYEAVRELGGEIGRAVVERAASIATDADAEVAIRTDRIVLQTHADAGEGDARRIAALRALDLPPDAGHKTHELFGLVSPVLRDLPAEERRERAATVRLYLRDRTSARFAGGNTPRVELQGLRIGAARFLALPLEATVDVGLDWAARFPGAPAAVLSIANGWLRYLPHPRNFEEPDASRHYEVLQSTFVPDTATRLLDRGAEMALA